MLYHAVILLLIKINLEENTGYRPNSTLGSWLDILTSSQLSPSLPAEGKSRKSVGTRGMQSQRSSDLISWKLVPQGAVATVHLQECTDNIFQLYFQFSR